MNRVGKYLRAFNALAFMIRFRLMGFALFHPVSKALNPDVFYLDHRVWVGVRQNGLCGQKNPGKTEGASVCIRDVSISIF